MRNPESSLISPFRYSISKIGHSPHKTRFASTVENDGSIMKRKTFYYKTLFNYPLVSPGRTFRVRDDEDEDKG